MRDLSPRTALVAGATGLVGGHVLRLLLADPDYQHVTVLVRRTQSFAHPKLTVQVVEFDRLAELTPFPKTQDVFCCLGTTIRLAGSREAFSKVDFTYVHDVARLAARQGAKQFLLVSAVAANARSRVFYNQVKGKVEDAVRSLPLHGIHIFRPSLLLGERTASRPGEGFATLVSRALMWAFVGPLARYRPIKAETVALAMVHVAKQSRPGAHVYENEAIAPLATL